METVEMVPSNTKEGKGRGLACVPTLSSVHGRREKRSGTKDGSRKERNWFSLNAPFPYVPSSVSLLCELERWKATHHA